MQIRSLRLWNFRGFASSNYDHEIIDGPYPVVVEMAADTTVFIGRNGAGKSAMLQALLRLFGETHDERRIQAADFFVDPGERLESQSRRELFLEAEIVFPELGGNDPDAERTVPSAFRHMIVTGEGKTPFARIRLEATWELGGTLDGVIEEKLFWLLTPDDIPTGDGNTLLKRKVTASERSHIIVRYIPASRDVTALTQLTVRSLGRSLMNAVVWQHKEEIAELVSKAAEKLDAEGALARVNEAINACWSELNTAETGTTAKLAVLAPDLQQIVRSATIQLSPSSQGRTMAIEDLSDGQRSLFHFALVKALLDLKLELEAEVREAKDPPFEAAFARAPALTVFAFEEPENHLAPFFLARLLMQLAALTKTSRVQGILTSHAPSIVGRIDPKAIRHIRRETKSGLSTVSALLLPGDGTEAAKFVREAVRAHPEIYFARHAVFGEGASEEIVLPWLAEKIGVPMDRSFVAIVPVGGRHIQHFWRLVGGLGIPHSTLLDLDLGRSSGDVVQFRSIANAIKARGQQYDEETQKWLDTAAKLERPRAWGGEGATQEFFQRWISWFEQFGVFFSAPLDLDMLMIEAFPEAYKTLPARARGPKDPDDAEVIAKSAKEVVGADGFGAAVYEDEKLWPLFSWYKYLFLGSRGKPAAHLSALGALEDDVKFDAALETPDVVLRLIRHVKASLEAPTA